MALKVYTITGARPGVRSPNGSRQTQEIVAAPSMKEAARLFGVSLHVMRTYGHETGNKGSVAVAMERPGVVFYAPVNEALRDSVVWREADR
jgi:hypothetical protein